MSDTNEGAVPVNTLTRRQAIAATALVLGGLAARPLDAWPATANGVFQDAERIHHEPVFKATPRRVYTALTDAKQFDQVERLSAAVRSGAPLGSKPTEISGEEGGKFTLFGGHIYGRHIELVPGARIVQAWRVSNWNPGVYSLAQFELIAQGGDTRIIFDHTGFPGAQGAHLAEGWNGNYWEPLTKYLALHPAGN